MVAQKQHNISDKAMLSRMIISLCVILACLTALSFSACAWYSLHVSSGTNTLTAANFDLYVMVTSNGATQSEEIPEDYVYSLTEGEYTVTLTNTGNAVNGFCVVKVMPEGETEETYHTLQIPRGETLELRLKLSNFEEPVKVAFIPTIGTSSYFGTTGEPLYLEAKYLEITGVPDP